MPGSTVTTVSRDHKSAGPTPAGCTSAGTGEMLPDIMSRTTGGDQISLGQYRARRNLVVVLSGGDEGDTVVSGLLAALAGSRTAIAKEDAEVLVVRPSSADKTLSDGAHPFVTIMDQDGQYHRCVGAIDPGGLPVPAVFVTDRYREIYHAFRPTDPGWPPDADDVESWLVFMNIQCPECGVPEW